MNPLGFIRHQDRNILQWDAHRIAERAMHRHHGLPPVRLASGQAVRLFDAWKDPKVIADVGFIFPRFHQLTGSCVGAGGGQALFSLIAVQRCLSQGSTKAFLPFWPFDYGMCRLNEGDRGQGEGAMGSSFADTVVKNGVINATEGGLPKFQDNDGLVLTNQLEMQWSDGAGPAQKYLTAAKVHPVGSAAPCKTPDDIAAAVTNGYPVTFACNNYIGKASVQGSGADACVMGFWDGRGGHQQSVHGVWQHPQFGRIFWAQNNWPAQVYPADPAGGPPCGCWVTDAHVAAALRLDSEVYALSHLNWFPAQPELLDWYV